jgi:ABC-type transport system involved in multi-copper enzyme maturation permease subunit
VKTIAVIALNTFKETLRDRIFYNLLVFGFLLILSALVLTSLSIGEHEKILKDIGMAGMELFGVLIAIFVGITLISREIERRTIYTLIAKPVRRYEFIVGRYAGLSLTLLVNTLVMLAAFSLVLVVGHVVPDGGLMTAIGLIVLGQLVVMAVAVMFSTFTTPTLSATFTLAFYVIGRLAGDLRALAEKVPAGVGRLVLQGIYAVLPNLAYFNVKGQAVYGLPIETGYVWQAIGYGLGYTVMFVGLACVIFQRRDF